MALAVAFYRSRETTEACWMSGKKDLLANLLVSAKGGMKTDAVE